MSAGNKAPQIKVILQVLPLPDGGTGYLTLELQLKQRAATLEDFFAAAWNEVPAARRPQIECSRGVVEIHVTDDAQIAQLNQEHMGHEGPTDVLSFPMGNLDPERDAWHFGEIIVSYSTALREAEARGLSSEEEFARYCVHGFLHLLGYEDETESKRRAMFKVQEAALKAALPAPKKSVRKKRA